MNGVPSLTRVLCVQSGVENDSTAEATMGGESNVHVGFRLFREIH